MTLRELGCRDCEATPAVIAEYGPYQSQQALDAALARLAEKTC
jgi:hypothetical protein